MTTPSAISFPALTTAAVGELRYRTGDGLELIGMSAATLATAFVIKPFGIAVDMGRCSPLLASQDTVLLTHCHSDHTAGLLAWLSARVRRHRGSAVRVAVPAAKRSDLLLALESWPDLEVVRRRINLEEMLVPIEAGDELRLADGGWARAFALHHTTVCAGWHIGAAEHSRPRVAIAGDSTILPFRDNPELLDADLAVVECTFVEPGSRVAARLSGHAHLQEWLELMPTLSCGHLVLAHLPQEITAPRLLELLAQRPDAAPLVVPWLVPPGATASATTPPRPSSP